MEGCRSGLTGGPGKTVCRKAPWVRIPPSPPRQFFIGATRLTESKLRPECLSKNRQQGGFLLKYGNMEKDIILKVENLNVAFGEEKVIEDLSFDLEEKELLVILGPNGAGKSTHLKTLLGLVPYEGKIQWKDSVHIGYVPNEFVIPDNLPLNLREFFQFKKDSPEKIYKALEWVGIKSSDKILEKKLYTLSSGQLRRTLIAWAMSDDPDIIFLDEPMLFIDIHGRETIYDSLVRIWEEKKQSIILVSHEVGEVCKKADKVLALNKRKLFYGPPKEIITPQNLAKIYGSPISL